MINGKSVEKIREFFQVDNDLTSDEQKDVCCPLENCDLY